MITGIVTIGYHLYFLVPFLPPYKLIQKKPKGHGKLTKPLKIISSNVYQFNTDFQSFRDLIRKYQPDLFITYESNQDWENAMNQLQDEYPHALKIAQENTYGMHLYSKIPLDNSQVHHFVTDDIPSIEVFLDWDGKRIHFFGVHPPPPSPTEEETSKERDGELMSVAKYIKDLKTENIIVVGDFNNVAWARTSRRFRRITRLIDPRIGRGFIPTFHAKYPFMMIPIDLLFHSPKIVIDKIKATESINSDHFPLYFTVQVSTQEENETKEDLEKGDLEEMEEDIQEGKATKGDR